VKQGLRGTELRRAIDTLEADCQNRARDRLLKSIPTLLAQVRDTGHVRLRALDWYWRAGLHKEGVKAALCHPISGERVASQSALLSLPEEQLLWASRFLISVGAWPVGQNLLGHLHPRSTRGRVLLAMDHLGLGNHAQVVSTLEKVSASPAREIRWHVITTFARAYLELGENTLAHRWAKRGLEVVKTDPDRWVLECLRAMAVAALGENRKGLELFAANERRIADIAALAPHWFGYSRIWKSRLLVALGQRQAARACLDQAQQHYERGMQDLQPWRTLMVLDEMKTQELLTPRERDAYDRYPLKPPLCRNQSSAPWESSSSIYQLQLSADEWTEKGQPRLGIPLDLRLAAALTLAGDIGIHTNLLKCWLWPEALASFFQLDGRLTQLVHRLRFEHGFHILRERDSLWMDPAGRSQLSVQPGSDEPPAFVTMHGKNSFAASEVARFYSVSTRTAQLVLAKWLETGWLKREGAGRATQYQMIRATRGHPA
jgi:hypothetical protein